MKSVNSSHMGEVRGLNSQYISLILMRVLDICEVIISCKVCAELQIILENSYHCL